MDSRRPMQRPIRPDAKSALKKALLLKNIVLFLAAAALFWFVMFEWKVSDSFMRLGIYAIAALLIFLLGNWLDGSLEITKLSEKVAKMDAEEAERKQRENRSEESKDE